MAEPRPTPTTPISLIRVGFKAQDIASVRVQDTDMIVILKNGQRVVLRDGAMRAMIDPELRIAMADGELRAADLLKQVGSVKVDELAQAVVNTAQPDPASGTVAKGGAVSAAEADSPVVAELTRQSNETNASLREFISVQKAQNEALARNYEVLSEKITQITASNTAPATPEVAKGGFLSSISPAWGALGALGAVGGGGGGTGSSSSGSTGPVSLVTLVLTGNITLGPALSGNQMRVTAYDRDGNRLGADESVDAVTGAYSISISNGYTGLMILKVSDGGAGADYMDEATGAGKSLGSTDMRAMVMASGTGTLTAHINPLTELAAVKAGMSTGSVAYSGAADSVINISKSLAAKLGLSTSGQLLTDIAVQATIKVDGTSNPNPNDAGRLLEAISSVEKINNVTTNSAVAILAAQFVVDNNSGTASYADGSSVKTIEEVSTAILTTPPNVTGIAFRSPGLSVSNDSGAFDTDLITNNANTDLTVSLSKPLGSGSTIAWKTTDSPVWSTPIAGSDTESMVVFSGVVLPSGRKTLQFQITTIATNLSNAAAVDPAVNLVYELDTTLPTTPVITQLGLSADTAISTTGSATTNTDFVTSKGQQVVTGTISTEVKATERIFGSVDGGSNFTEVTSRQTLSTGVTTFTWDAPALFDQTAVMNTGSKSMVFKLVDVAGNTSLLSNATPYTLDTSKPSNNIDQIAFSSDTGTAGDFITATKKQLISGVLANALDTSEANGETLWGSVNGGTSWTNLNGFIAGLNSGGRTFLWSGANLIEGANTLKFKITDVAGNTLASVTDSNGNTRDLGSTAYFLQTAPKSPNLALAADTAVGSSTNVDGITRNGQYIVTGVEAGNTWEYTLNGNETDPNNVIWRPGDGSNGTTKTTDGGTFMAGGGIGTSVFYALGAIQVRQINSSLVPGAVATNLIDITVDQVVLPPTLNLAEDSANGTITNVFTDTNGITKNGKINVTGLETGSTWRYSLDGGINWQTGGTNITGTTGFFTLPSSGLAGTSYAASSIKVEQTDAAGNVSTWGTLDKAITVKTQTPTQTITGTDLSADSGTLATGFYSANGSTQNTDFVTNVAAQTITATLSGALNPGETLYGRIAGDAAWTALNNNVTTANGVTTLTWNRTLTGGSGVVVSFQIVDNAGNTSSNLGAITYTLDTVAPGDAQNPNGAIALANGISTIGFNNDSASAAGSSSDRITNANTQRIQTQLTRALVSSGTNTETLWASVDSGATWINITSFLKETEFLDWNMTATNTTLVASTATAVINNLLFKVTDLAGNSSTIVTAPYRYNPDVPTPALVGQLDSSSDTFGSLNGTTVGDTIDFRTKNTTGLVYRGTVDPGAAVAVTIGTKTYNTTANSTTGAYTITTDNTPLAEDSYAPTVFVTDLAGNTKSFTGTAFRVDTSPNTKLAGEPGTALLGQLDADSDTFGTVGTSGTPNYLTVGVGDFVTRQTTNLIYRGVVEAGAVVAVTINGVTKTVLANGTDGSYAITYDGSELSQGWWTPTVTVADKAGNSPITANGTAFRVDTSPNTKLAGEPGTALLGQLGTASDGADGTPNLTSTKTSLVYSGVVEAGAAVAVTIGASTYTATADGTTGAYTITTNTTPLADGTYTPTVVVVDKAGNSTSTTTPLTGTAFTVDATAPTASVSGASYYAYYAQYDNGANGAQSRTLVLTGSDFQTLLQSNESLGTDIKGRLDWSKLSYDYDSDDTDPDTAGTFTLNDIDSAIVTNATTLTIQLKAPRAKALEDYSNGTDFFGADSNAGNDYWTTGAGAGKGNQADSIDIAAGFLRDKVFNASNAVDFSGVMKYAAPTAEINLINSGYSTYFGSGASNSAGKLIAPVVVAVNNGTLNAPIWVNKIFYYWDLSGDGSKNNTTGTNSIISSDLVGHNRLDEIFKFSSDFTTPNPSAWDPSVGNAQDTTSKSYNTTDYRYASLTTAGSGSIKLALPTALAADDRMISDLNITMTDGAQRNQLSDLPAIWDATNGVVPTGWQTTNAGATALGGNGGGSGGYWSSTASSISNPNAQHQWVDLVTGGNVGGGSGGNNVSRNVALELYAPHLSVTSATYYGTYDNEALLTNGTTRSLVLNGFGFSTLLESGETIGASGTDIKARLDWSKLVYDYDAFDPNGGSTVGNRAFSSADIQSAIVSSDNTLTIKLVQGAAGANAATQPGSGAKGLEGFNNGTDYFGADSNANNAYWTSGAGAGKGNQADGIDISAGFFKDSSGASIHYNVYDNLAVTYAGPVQSISFGTYGNLIAPVVVSVNIGGLGDSSNTLTDLQQAPNWVNKTFYYWDLSGNGTSSNTQGGSSIYGSDFMTHDFLDVIFTRSSPNGTEASQAGFLRPSNATGFNPGDPATWYNTTNNGQSITNYNTTSAYSWNGSKWVSGTDTRYGDLAIFNNLKLALPVGMNASYDTFGPVPNGTIIFDSERNQLSDMTAIWDLFGTPSNKNSLPAPSGWGNSNYWSATLTGNETHFSLTISTDQYRAGSDGPPGRYVALQVL